MTRRSRLAGAACAAVLALGACGDDDDAPSRSAAASASSPTGGPGAGTSTGGAPRNTAAAPPGDAAWAAAVATAEADAGGAAVAIDAGRDGFEVDVAVGDRTVEVRLGATGTDVLRRTDDEPLDADERAALEGGVPLTDAVATALAEVPGTLDGADPGSAQGTPVWEVDVETGTGDVEVVVDASTGDVVHVERDD